MYHLMPGYFQAGPFIGALGGDPPGKIIAPLEKCVGHSLKILGRSQKILRHPWCPKLVTGLLCKENFVSAAIPKNALLNERRLAFETTFFVRAAATASIIRLLLSQFFTDTE